MSDYSNTFGGASKDSLQDTILGSEHDTEYNAIAVASATKANKTGAPATTNNLAMLTATGDLADSLIETDGSGTSLTCAALVGDLTGDVTGNADTATTAGGLTGTTLSGDVTNSGNAITLVDTIAGNRILLRTQSASASSSIDFVDGVSGAVIDSTYDVYEIELINVIPATDAILRLTVSDDTGVSWESTNYNDQTGNTAYWAVTGAITVEATTSAGVNCTIRMYSPDASLYTMFGVTGIIHSSITGNSATIATNNCGYNIAGAIDGVRIAFPSVNIASGTLNLYGIKK